MANKKEREVKERNQERKKAGRKEQDVYINAAIMNTKQMHSNVKNSHIQWLRNVRRTFLEPSDVTKESHGVTAGLAKSSGLTSIAETRSNTS